MKKLPRFPAVCGSCGAAFEVSQKQLDNGRGKYCSRSCSAQTNSKHHGHTVDDKFSPTYNSWVNMRSRCNNPKNPKYPAYGAKGITVCERWSTFANFLEDMGERPAGMTLDRQNGTLGYYKENCRWATNKEQQRNIRSNLLVTLKGRTQCLEDWAKEIGIDPAGLRYRIRQNWAEADMLLPPGARRDTPLPLPCDE